ncbi:Hypothetical protein FKW44_015263 [Caligus rogercresseyi]|uniref:Uncharacterized protein n=1 Tax=Caligus rogercresseyi TaxID=217165 RepID=A0A7T8H0D5_CALRO|nr:Hypothetical protein FKW44_015263 [Caligus rogercresseyi]
MEGHSYCFGWRDKAPPWSKRRQSFMPLRKKENKEAKVHPSSIMCLSKTAFFWVLVWS